jgi:hypothetical protein
MKENEMKSNLICAVALVVLLAGCAPMIWDKSGATQNDYNKDSYDCEKDARQSGYYGGGIAGGLEMKEFFKRCMVSKGYSLRNN